MGIIVNPRGTSGSGKTELARRIMAQYGWRRSADCAAADGLEPVWRAERKRPLGYRLRHPLGGRPLAVLGDYQVTSGGCDTIRAADGGLDEIVRRAAGYAATGHDVLIEGKHLSSEHERSAVLARAHRLHVLHLTTPVEQCARNLVCRRRAPTKMLADLASGLADEHELVADACERLGQHAMVEALAFDHAIARAQDLLGLPPHGSGAREPATVMLRAERAQ